MNIQELDEYCRLHNKAVMCRAGRFCGLLNGYYVGDVDE